MILVVEELLNELHEKTILTKINLKLYYYQIKMKKEDV